MLAISDERHCSLVQFVETLILIVSLRKYSSKIYSISDMLTKVTGRNLDSSFFDIYLRDKYRRLFG